MIVRAAYTFSAALTFALAFAAFAASGFDGTWMLTAPAGEVVEMVIDDNKATSEVEGAKSGTVTEKGDSAVINWESGVVSVISKQGEGYVLNSYATGTPLDGTPIATLSAQRK